MCPFSGPRAGKGVIFLLSIHKTINGKMTRLDGIQDGCWVNLTYPSEDELTTVAATLNVDPAFLRAALDEEETSRIDTEEGQTLIIIDLPAEELGARGFRQAAAVPLQELLRLLAQIEMSILL